jgi:hypothetical protein
MKRLYKNWFIHNVVAHPLMQIVVFFNYRLANFIHDVTLPKK